MKIILAAMLISSMSIAALPAYPERTHEIQMILIDGTIEAMLKDEKLLGATTGVIDALEFLGAKENVRSWKLRSGSCTLDVTLTALTSDSPGPVQFDVKPAKQMQCKKKS